LTAALEQLPQWPPSAALALALNRSLGRVLPRGVIEPLLGRSVQLRVRDAGITLTVRYLEGRFVAGDARSEVDVTIEADLATFAALALRQEDPDTMFFDRRLQFTGDTELGLVVKNALNAISLPAMTTALRAIASLEREVPPEAGATTHASRVRLAWNSEETKRR